MNAIDKDMPKSKRCKAEYWPRNQADTERHKIDHVKQVGKRSVYINQLIHMKSQYKKYTYSQTDFKTIKLQPAEPMHLAKDIGRRN